MGEFSAHALFAQVPFGQQAPTDRPEILNLEKKSTKIVNRNNRLFILSDLEHWFPWKEPIFAAGIPPVFSTRSE